MRQRTSILQNIDWVTIFLYLLLVLIGWVNIYAAEYNIAHTSIFDKDMNYGKQMVWILTSVFLIMLILIIDAKFFTTFSWVIYILVMGMLIGVLLFGREIAGSKSWFQVGSFSLQPSEFAKFATALALAKFISKINTGFTKLSSRITAGGIIFVPIVLILLQHDTG